MITLQSYARGEWIAGEGDAVSLVHAATGVPVAEVPRPSLDYAAMRDHARRRGGPALRKMTFHQRAMMLKALATYLLERKERYYGLCGATGATHSDAWIDIEGGIGTLFSYSGKGRRELPNSDILVDGEPEILSRNGGFVGQHVFTPLLGVAVHVNAFNFPCWGMLEKLAPTLLAGMPAIIKPATQTAYVAERMFRDIVDSGVLPEGAVQLICGGVGDLFDHLDEQDVVTFTGSSTTGRMLKRHPAIIDRSVRFNMESDSLNCAILGADARPDSDEFGLFVAELAREMTIKCGQRCTAIRRAIVPRPFADAVIDALWRRLEPIRIGDPDDPRTQLGPLVGRAQRDEMLSRVEDLLDESELAIGDAEFSLAGYEKGAFVSPMALYCDSPIAGAAVHEIEAFGPVTSLLPYDSEEDALELARRGRGSLVGSAFTRDDALARRLVLGAAAHHGRLLIINRACGAENTGHGSPMPGLVHGGPGRAGGGEELGGVRAMRLYMQRTALQGSPETITRVCGKWLPGAAQREDSRHPFRKSFDELKIGDCLVTATRTISLEDIEHFASFTGDTFYAHMDEQAARANPFFDGRVAHGYFIVSAAAGLFVDPDPGPVLANYGLENLRFMQPVYPGDTLRVTLTCKQKTARENDSYGEVRWDVVVVNQESRVVARYDVLTLVAQAAANNE
ncbi:MAG: phenylacetic acid degradation bifunctional protein PaaZ [Proteobacteria bacterium]|nr:MAG: phenylacetic acid degradation bifunctional protein PaaZ [Pseudomonadota bacterium]